MFFNHIIFNMTPNNNMYIIILPAHQAPILYSLLIDTPNS